MPRRTAGKISVAPISEFAGCSSICRRPPVRSASLSRIATTLSCQEPLPVGRWACNRHLMTFCGFVSWANAPEPNIATATPTTKVTARRFINDLAIRLSLLVRIKMLTVSPARLGPTRLPPAARQNQACSLLRQDLQPDMHRQLPQGAGQGFHGHGALRLPSPADAHFVAFLLSFFRNHDVDQLKGIAGFTDKLA